MTEHRHQWAASAVFLGFLMNSCPCGAKRFLGGYTNPRCDRIVQRLNRSWRVR